MKKDRKIVVEALIPAPVELVWERTQDPEQHRLWDIRFSTIRYLEQKDERGFHLMDYRTKIGFGITVVGIGRYLQSRPPQASSFEFESGDWKSLITSGRGIWLYENREGQTYFKTVYDYELRYGPWGRCLDRLFFRPLMRLATEWGFETLRRWCGGDANVLARRRKRAAFVFFFVGRLFGKRPKPGEAKSWLGSGRESGDDIQ